MFIAEQIGQALTKKLSRLHLNGLDTTENVFFTPSVWSKSLFLFLQPLLTICSWHQYFVYGDVTGMMTRYFLKLTYYMPSMKLDLQWSEQMEDPQSNARAAMCGPGGCEIRLLPGAGGGVLGLSLRMKGKEN